MSCNYADGLSPYDDKGVLGVPEIFETPETVENKCTLLAEWIQNARHVVFHTGAGISTSAGIPDFRGPNGVWTLERKGEKPTINISFDNAQPTKTHMALKKLVDVGYVKYIVSQNIDGLHLKSGVPRKNLAELHGNMFIEMCNVCDCQFVRSTATTTVGQKSQNITCRRELTKSRRACRGKLCDTILDWEDNLPDYDLTLSQLHSSVANLNVCLGTTLQIVPSGNLPLSCKKYSGKVVIVNLQPTKHDKKADLKINTYVDDVLSKVMKKLGLEIPDYDESSDPTKNENVKNNTVTEWTIPKSYVKEARDLFNRYCPKNSRKRKSGGVDVGKMERKIVKSDVIIEKSDVKNEDSDFEDEIKVEKQSDMIPLRVDFGSSVKNYSQCNQGKFQNPWLESNVPQLPTIIPKGIQLARRNSGGGTVYHDSGNLNITFFTPREHYKRSYNLNIISKAINRRFGLTIEISKREDLVYNNYKISGTASKLGRLVAYHHCTLLVNADEKVLSKSLEKPDYQIKTNATRSIKSAVKNLCDINSKITMDELIVSICEEYLTTPYTNKNEEDIANKSNDVEYVLPSEDRFNGITEIRDEFKSYDWIYGKCPKFSAEKLILLNGTSVNSFLVKMDVEGGEIMNISIEPNLEHLHTNFSIELFKNRKFSPEIFNEISNMLMEVTNVKLKTLVQFNK